MLSKTLKNAKRILIKIGSSSLTSEKGINKQKIAELVKDIAELREVGKEVILVSSGAIASGKEFIEVNDKSPIPIKQAASAIGQPHLMATYQSFFEKEGIRAAQILLTHQDLNRKQNFHNLEKCLEAIIENKNLAILNENDSVSFEEITFGDNDQLAARIAMMMNVDVVIYLTKAKGLLLDNDQVLQKTFDIKDLNQIKKQEKTKEGSGGILAKIEAIKKLNEVNITAVVSSSEINHPIQAIFSKEIGSWILPQGEKKKTRQRRIVSQSKTNASISIDDGAYQALLKKSSLLPKGIKKVNGYFQRGDSILIKNKRKTVAYGISEYSSKDVEAIKGKKSSEIKETLGYHISNVIIHRDYLVLGKEK